MQNFLKVNGNKFLAAIASGDLATAEAPAAASNEEAPMSSQQRPKIGMPDEDQIVGRAKLPTSRCFFSFGAGSDDMPEVSVGKTSVNNEDRALLQEALYDFLNCERLLEHVR
ncbi:hypothetical protein C8J32_11039 [Rhizobium sp. PP-CC-3A-592]|nr:hypothetical protein C8J32_11039 [Rhizobium sp. PP-CC-3A-592]